METLEWKHGNDNANETASHADYKVCKGVHALASLILHKHLQALKHIVEIIEGQRNVNGYRSVLFADDRI